MAIDWECLKSTQGERNRQSKLTESQVFEIRKIYAGNGRPCEHAKRFGISESHFVRVGKRLCWKHV